MAPLTNTTTTHPLEPLLTTVDSLLTNPTVTPTDKAIYLVGVTFTALCLILDIGMLVFLGWKLYGICRGQFPYGRLHDSETEFSRYEKVEKDDGEYEKMGYDDEYYDAAVKVKDGEKGKILYEDQDGNDIGKLIEEAVSVLDIQDAEIGKMSYREEEDKENVKPADQDSAEKDLRSAALMGSQSIILTNPDVPALYYAPGRGCGTEGVNFLKPAKEEWGSLVAPIADATGKKD
ncbi:MAG: hypothetical protein Q9166_003252 [cf. Caloplaca sp. 2 TL-2023]